MMNILEEIIQFKYQEVAERKRITPGKTLEQAIHFNRPVVSMKECILQPDKTGIIAEIKRKSPSKGIINGSISVEDIARGYTQAGVSGLSVLTDLKYFGGTNEDLMAARASGDCPILRKDFVVDEYQILEAKAIGADVILLIAAALKPNHLKRLAEFAHALKLEVLLEIHNEREWEDNAGARIDMLGVNNRDLKTFITDTAVSIRLAEKIPATMVKVSESGIENPETIIELRKHGYKGFLMGQSFMQNHSPEKACQEFVNRLRKMESEV